MILRSVTMHDLNTNAHKTRDESMSKKVLDSYFILVEANH